MSAVLLAGLSVGEKIISAISGFLSGKHDEKTAALAIDAAYEEHAHELDMKLQESQMLGFGGNTRFDSFVDGMNRLVRPVVTYGVIGIFVYSAVDGEGFTVYSENLAALPNWLWALVATVIGFWFGGRALKDWGQFVQPMAGNLLKSPTKNVATVKQDLTVQAQPAPKKKQWRNAE